MSVALCTFDGGPHLEEQLASLLAQTTPPDEVVVGDDGSTDDTLERLGRFRDQAPFPVRVHAHDHLGPNANFAATIGRCDGDLIALCDQDDRWHPDRLASGVAGLARRPDALLAFSDADLVDDDGDPLGRRLWASLGIRHRDLVDLRDDPLAALLRRPMVTGCTTTFRRDLLDLADPVPLDPGVQHDRWLAMCAAALGPLVALDDTLVDYRVHPAQHTGLGPLSTTTHRPRGRLHWSRWGRARRTGDDRLRPTLALVEELQARLGRDRQDDTAAAVRTVAECRTFLDHRSALPPSRRHRVGAVAHHARTGSYRRFSTGWVGVLADLLRP